MRNSIIVTIIGTNSIQDYKCYSYFEEKIYEILEKYFEENYEVVIREQEKNLIDTFSVRFAKENNCQLERYKIDWDTFGKKASYENIKRLVWGDNGESGCDILICFRKKKEEENIYLNIYNNIIEEFKSMILLDSYFENFCYEFILK